jgi:hypothetical protein
MTPDLVLAPVVRRIFAEARDGYTPGRIAKGLNADGIESPSGRAWNRQTVRNIVENVVYAGERYGVKRAHPATVSRRLFNAANEELRARARPRDGS